MGYLPWGSGTVVPESPILCTVSLHCMLQTHCSLPLLPFGNPRCVSQHHLYLNRLAKLSIFHFLDSHSQESLMYMYFVGHALNALLCLPPPIPQN